MHTLFVGQPSGFFALAAHFFPKTSNAWRRNGAPNFVSKMHRSDGFDLLVHLTQFAWRAYGHQNDATCPPMHKYINIYIYI